MSGLKWYQRPEARKRAAPKWFPPQMQPPGVLFWDPKADPPCVENITFGPFLAALGRIGPVMPRAHRDMQRLIWLSEHGRPAQRKRAEEIMS